jgi:hypothetical protein
MVGGRYATAAIMAADDYMLHAQDIDGVLQHREAVEIRVHHEIGDIPVDKDLAGRQPDDLIRRHAAIGAADPQILGCLLRGEPSEEIRIGTELALRPATVIRKEVFQRHFRGSIQRRRHDSHFKARQEQPSVSISAFPPLTLRVAGRARQLPPQKQLASRLRNIHIRFINFRSFAYHIRFRYRHVPS